MATERVTSFVRINRWLLVSLVLLGTAVYLSSHYIDQVLQTVPQKGAAVAQTTILVARGTIPAYTVIEGPNLMTETVPSADVPPGAYTDSTQVVGQWSNEVIQSGLPIVSSAVFLPKSANILASRIRPGDMAVDLPLGANSVVDGLVNPGDTISLFTTITESTGQQVTEDFLNGVKVLAVNGSLAPATTPTTGQNLTLILALPPERVAQLLFVEQKGLINAVLDAPNASTIPPTPYGSQAWEKPVS